MNYFNITTIKQLRLDSWHQQENCHFLCVWTCVKTHAHTHTPTHTQGGPAHTCNQVNLQLSCNHLHICFCTNLPFSSWIKYNIWWRKRWVYVPSQGTGSFGPTGQRNGPLGSTGQGTGPLGSTSQGTRSLGLAGRGTGSLRQSVKQILVYSHFSWLFLFFSCSSERLEVTRKSLCSSQIQTGLEAPSDTTAGNSHLNV